MIKGIGVSPGISIGRAFVIKRKNPVFTGILLNSVAEAANEVQKFDNAVIAATNEVEDMVKDGNLILSDDDAAILETQIEFLSDPQIKENVTEKINGEKKNANDALIAVIADMVELFENMGDEYMRARAADVKDIGARILKHLDGPVKTGKPRFEAGTIIIADDIAPSDLIGIDPRYVLGFVTSEGSKTSHAAIIARSKGIPAIVGCGDSLNAIKADDVIIVDGITGFMYVNPHQQIIDGYKIKQEAFIKKADQLRTLKAIPAITKDGTKVMLSANISNADDMEKMGEKALAFYERNCFLWTVTHSPLKMNNLNFISRLLSGQKINRLL